MSNKTKPICHRDQIQTEKSKTVEWKNMLRLY